MKLQKERPQNAKEKRALLPKECDMRRFKVPFPFRFISLVIIPFFFLTYLFRKRQKSVLSFHDQGNNNKTKQSKNWSYIFYTVFLFST